MQRRNPADYRVMLQGEWTMSEATERLGLLSAELSEQLLTHPRPPRTDIEFAGVTDIDACGCQLLTLFLEHLKRHDILPRPTRLPDPVRETISLLGFGETLATPEAAEEETP